MNLRSCSTQSHSDFLSSSSWICFKWFSFSLTHIAVSIWSDLDNIKLNEPNHHETEIVLLSTATLFIDTSCKIPHHALHHLVQRNFPEEESFYFILSVRINLNGPSRVEAVLSGGQYPVLVSYQESDSFHKLQRNYLTNWVCVCVVWKVDWRILISFPLRSCYLFSMTRPCPQCLIPRRLIADRI